MKQWIIISSACLVLSACSGAGPGALLNDIWRSSSGNLAPINDVLEFGKQVQTNIETTVDDIQDRIHKVQSGVDLLINAKDLIQDGVVGE